MDTIPGSPVPEATREDVAQAIQRYFPAEDPNTVAGWLDEYGTEPWHGERDRVQLAILELSRGDIQKLMSLVRIAQSDYREVLGPAEYPGFKIDETLVPSRPPISFSLLVGTLVGILLAVPMLFQQPVDAWPIALGVGTGIGLLAAVVLIVFDRVTS